VCIILFIGADVSLPLIRWDKQRPAFNVEPVDHAYAGVAAHLGTAVAACAGSHEGCGCGFRCDAASEDLADLDRLPEGNYPGSDVGPRELARARADDALRSRESVRLLRDYVIQLRRRSRVVLCPTWSGELKPARRRTEIEPSFFDAEAAHFNIGEFENDFLIIEMRQ
jgi:hypothetical protein